nr:reverse transcriptase domain-containing protein [Tanacetum cinerariifolium]
GRIGRSSIRYGSSRSLMSDQDSHGIYSSRQGMAYSGAIGSEPGGMYTSSSYDGDYISRDRDIVFSKGVMHCNVYRLVIEHVTLEKALVTEGVEINWGTKRFLIGQDMFTYELRQSSCRVCIQMVVTMFVGYFCRRFGTSIHHSYSEDGNPARANVKQALGRCIVDVAASFQLSRIYIPHAHTLAFKVNQECIKFEHRTRSSARNLFSPLDNPELTIQKRPRVDPTLLNDLKMVTNGKGDDVPPSEGGDLPVPDLRTMEELCQPTLNGRGGPIALIAIQATNFRLKNDMIQQVQNSYQFHGLSDDDANKHLDKFLHRVKAPVSALKPNLKPSIPYPSRLHDQKLCYKANDQKEKFFQIFKDLDFNISFADSLILMPKFGLTIKSLLTNKEKLFKLARTLLNEHCLAALLKKLPEKLGTPLSLPKMCPTYMTLELADHSISRPVGVIEDVFVKVGTFHFPSTFVVVDFDADPRVPLILGRSFLKTGRALIDVYEGELTLRVSKKAITFNLDQTSRYSANYDAMSVNQIDFIDVACEEYYQEVLGFSVVEPTNERSSIDEPPMVKLKDLPPHLEYAFLEGDDKLPIIIAKDLKDVDKITLIKVLKSQKQALAWQLSDIKGWRVCIDYQKLNGAIRKDHFLIPFMDQMLEKLAGNKYYCFLDGFSGYFQIPIDPQDQEKTTFMCPYGMFAYRRMPFGLCNASGMFQRCMMAILHDMIEKTMEVFMDDFSVFGNSSGTYLSHLDKMLKWCEDTNLYLNWEKSHFMVKEGIILDHKISKNRI